MCGFVTGGIVSRDGRPVMGLTKTDKVRHAKYFIPTNDVLEEVVLYYRPRIYSHTPAPITSDPIPEAAAELQNQPQTGTVRRPLGDVGNRPLQPSATKDSADALKLYQEANRARSRFSATPNDTSDTEQRLSVANIKQRDSCTAGLVPPPPNQMLERLEPLSPQDVDTKLHESGLILTDPIKRRESGMIPMDQIKRRESDIVTMAQIKGQESKIIPADQIKRRESGMIPINQIKRRESGMIPINKVKRRESGMILMDEVKHQEDSSGLIPPGKIKRRESCLPKVFSVGEHSEEAGEELQMSPEGDRSFVIIDDTDDEDDDIYIVECQDDSVVYMGDDDCCVMDVSNNISLVELDMTIDSMDQLNLEWEDHGDLALQLSWICRSQVMVQFTQVAMRSRDLSIAVQKLVCCYMQYFRMLASEISWLHKWHEHFYETAEQKLCVWLSMFYSPTPSLIQLSPFFPLWRWGKGIMIVEKRKEIFFLLLKGEELQDVYDFF